MRSALYLRDARHLDKFIYTLGDKLFYEPYETRYQPSDEYLGVVTDLLQYCSEDWQVQREGFWFYVYPRHFAFPTQGWKVHVSATLANAASILRRTARILLDNKIPFKFALDKRTLGIFNSKRWGRGASGKFITIYPTDISSFKSVLEQLDAELHNEEGPYILSDQRYRDCRVLYYRYGGIARVTRMDITGEKIPVLLTPDGNTVPDIRTPYFALPDWESDPFPSSEEEEDLSLGGGKYVVQRALAFSNSGGVYLATDRDTGKDVVIKEARAHTLMDDLGNDAISLLKKEHEILELLKGTGIAPKPLDSFQEWENYYLVEEFIEGIGMREFMLDHSPLMKINPSLADSVEFYECFRTLFKNFAGIVTELHNRDVLFGDLSGSNIKIDPSTFSVRLIDFEGAFRPGVDKLTYLYTPGFRDPQSARKHALSVEDDLYALGAIMLYTLFPLPALSALRNDLYQTVLKTVLDDLGWSKTPVFEIINGLTKGDLTATGVYELFDQVAQILPPQYLADIDTDDCDTIAQELGRFILANVRSDKRGSLFPADPFVHETNYLSLGFGACGVVYALKKSGFEIPRSAWGRLEQQLDNVKAEDLPPGLLTGAAGIAWSLWEIGLEDRATAFMKMANNSPLLKQHHSYLYGVAGVGIANLFFYLRTKDSTYLAQAQELGEELLKTARESDNGVYWENNELVHIGFGYGQSGVALFFLRLYQLTGAEKFLKAGRSALEFDLAHAIESEAGILSFPRAPEGESVEPYIEEGSAGIAKVAIRYGLWDRVDLMLLDTHRKYSVFAGLLFGLGGFVDVLTDAFLFSNDVKYLEMAKRPIAGIRDIYLIKQAEGSTTPGDGLFRSSCDYATGVAGVLRALHRFTQLDGADFLLDEVVDTAFSDDEFALDLQTVGAHDE
jgi:serine/threonine protein kinase